MNATKPRHFRRTKLVNPRLQLKLIGIFAGMSALSLLVQSLLFGSRLSNFAAEMQTGGAEITNELPALLGGILLFSFGILLPATCAIGVFVTFRIAGPVTRFEKYLTAIAGGEEMGPCSIRKGDEFQNLCKLINEALEATREKGAMSAHSEPGSEETEQLRTCA